MGELKTSFVLKKYSEKEKQILLYGNFGYKEYDVLKEKSIYKPLRYYTGIKITLEEWDSEKKLPTSVKKMTELLKIKKTLIDIFNYLSGGEHKITPDLLKLELDKKLARQSKKNNVQKTPKNTIVFTDYIEQVILLDKTSREYTTRKGFTTLKNKIIKFEENVGVTLTTINLNEDLYLKFVAFIRDSVNKINSVWALLKNFQTVINEIKRKFKLKDIYSPSEELAKKDKVKKVNEEKVYLDFEMINQLIKYKPKTESLKNTKLILMCLVFTGCRYSDVFKIKPEYEYSKNGLKFRYTRFADQKQDSDIIVPLLKPLEKLLKANDNKPPTKIASQNFNTYVKELAKLSGLEELRTLSYTNSYGKTEYETLPLHQTISSHIGRRSFITNLINYIPVTILSKITGHSLTNRNVIFSYNKISLLDNAVLFLKELKRVQENYPKEFPIKLF